MEPKNIFNSMIQNQDQTQANQPSVFRFDTYPGPNSIYPPCDNYQEPVYSNNVNLQSNFMPSLHLPHVPSPASPQIPSVFSFGESPTVSQLPFQTVNNMGFPSEQRMRLILGKRKSMSPPPQPCKQHITEEKMAEHMSNLHISSETVTATIEPESVKNKRLYMCEELRKLQADPLLPPSLLNQISKPCTALVLWQPHPNLPKAISSSSAIANNNDEDNEDLEKDKNKFSSDSSMALEVVNASNQFGGGMDLDL